MTVARAEPGGVTFWHEDDGAVVVHRRFPSEMRARTLSALDAAVAAHEEEEPAARWDDEGSAPEDVPRGTSRQGVSSAQVATGARARESTSVHRPGDTGVVPSDGPQANDAFVLQTNCRSREGSLDAHAFWFRYAGTSNSLHGDIPMGNLTIRNLDDRVIAALKAQAKANQRSLEAEVRYLLTLRVDRRVRIAEFRERSAEIARMSAGMPQTDSVELLREDRER